MCLPFKECPQPKTPAFSKNNIKKGLSSEGIISRLLNQLVLNNPGNQVDCDFILIQMQQMLEKEIEQLRLEKLSLEVYIERTDLWCDYIGKWRTDICSAQVSFLWNPSHLGTIGTLERDLLGWRIGGGLKDTGRCW